MDKSPKKISLGKRLYIALALLILVSIGGGSATIYYIYRMQHLMDSVIIEDISSFSAAKEIQTSLLNQKGFATYYFLDGDEKWLEQLKLHRNDFEQWLQKAREFSKEPEEKELLKRIQSEYIEYVLSKERVIEYYRTGNRDKGAELHWEVREKFFVLYGLCEEYKKIFEKKISKAGEKSRKRARLFSGLALAGMSGVLVLGLILVFVLVTHILGPIRKLTLEAGPTESGPLEGDEVSVLSNRVHGLMEDMGHAKSELEKSREMLFQSEKMAVMGKLAADVAHSIRNPMTSIKMRLFSLERGLDLNPNQKEDFEVVSQEMHRLDNIVRNFLEFSRPPKLQMKRVNISEVFDMTLQLLAHRLEHDNVEVERPHRHTLPDIEADPELLKEVLVNLIVNAMEAMQDGGKIRITGEEAVAEEIGRAIMIRISDSGPGIPESIRDKVFNPFFSTKEEGTGLGLPIAMSIIKEHKGRIDLRPEEGGGTTFIIALPVWEEKK